MQPGFDVDPQLPRHQVLQHVRGRGDCHGRRRPRGEDQADDELRVRRPREGQGGLHRHQRQDDGDMRCHGPRHARAGGPSRGNQQDQLRGLPGGAGGNPGNRLPHSLPRALRPELAVCRCDRGRGVVRSLQRQSRGGAGSGERPGEEILLSGLPQARTILQDIPRIGS